MANFANIANALEGILNSQLNSTRSGQHVWEWYNALNRIMSANYVTGTPRLYGPVALADSDFVALETTNNTVLYGALVDNSNAAEAVFAQLIEAGATPGTEHQPGINLHVPAATMATFLFPGGILYATELAGFAGTGTDAALETTTGVTGTNPTILLVMSVP